MDKPVNVTLTYTSTPNSADIPGRTHALEIFQAFLVPPERLEYYHSGTTYQQITRVSNLTGFDRALELHLRLCDMFPEITCVSMSHGQKSHAYEYDPYTKHGVKTIL